MPPLHKQIKIAEAFTTSFTVVRGLLRAGRTYEEAVETSLLTTGFRTRIRKRRDAVRAVIYTCPAEARAGLSVH